MHHSQIRHGVDAPLSVDLRMAGLVEAWASGVAWEEVRPPPRWLRLPTRPCRRCPRGLPLEPPCLSPLPPPLP